LQSSVAHYADPSPPRRAQHGYLHSEAIAGFKAGSLSLVMDSVHNFSDELALVFLYLAFVLPQGLSRNLVRSANLFSSVG